MCSSKDALKLGGNNFSKKFSTRMQNSYISVWMIDDESKLMAWRQTARCENCGWPLPDEWHTQVSCMRRQIWEHIFSAFQILIRLQQYDNSSHTYKLQAQLSLIDWKSVLLHPPPHAFHEYVIAAGPALPTCLYGKRPSQSPSTEIHQWEFLMKFGRVFLQYQNRVWQNMIDV